MRKERQVLFNATSETPDREKYFMPQKGSRREVKVKYDMKLSSYILLKFIR